MAFHTNNGRHGNKGEAAIKRRLDYANGRLKELMAQGKSEAAAWDIVQIECKQGIPERAKK